MPTLWRPAGHWRGFRRATDLGPKKLERIFQSWRARARPYNGPRSPQKADRFLAGICEIISAQIINGKTTVYVRTAQHCLNLLNRRAPIIDARSNGVNTAKMPFKCDVYVEVYVVVKQNGPSSPFFSKLRPLVLGLHSGFWGGYENGFWLKLSQLKVGLSVSMQTWAA